MSERPWLRPAAGAVAVAALVLAAAVLVALAADVLRWDRQIRDGDIAYGTGAAASWEPNTLLPRGVSSSLLGVEDDLAYRHAVDRFWRSKPRDPIRVFEDVTRRSAAERVLGQAFTNDDNRTRRSQLAVLRAALMFEEGRNSPTQRQVFPTSVHDGRVRDRPRGSRSAPRAMRRDRDGRVPASTRCAPSEATSRARTCPAHFVHQRSGARLWS